MSAHPEAFREAFIFTWLFAEPTILALLFWKMKDVPKSFLEEIRCFCAVAWLYIGPITLFVWGSYILGFSESEPVAVLLVTANIFIFLWMTDTPDRPSRPPKGREPIPESGLQPLSINPPAWAAFFFRGKEKPILCHTTLQ